MFEMMLMRGGVARIPQGQVKFTTAVTNTRWVCPPGVFSVCCVLVGGGGASSKSATSYVGGNGGALRYQNDIPVTPGQAYLISVGGPSGISTAFGMSAGLYKTGSPVEGNIFGFNGGKGTEPGLSNACSGGNAAGYFADGGNSGSKYTGSGTDGYGNTNIRNEVAGNSGGDACLWGGGGGVWADGKGAWGLVRIIWGEGRAFPNKGLADVK